MHPRSQNLKIRLWLFATASLLASCSEKPVADKAAEPETAPFLPTPAAAASGCGDTGRLQTTLFGALAGSLEWGADTMNCEGMPRPAGRGARLRFSGMAGDSNKTIAIIIALPDLDPAQTAAELPSNVTVIEEGNGRFFSTPDLDNCWSDITDQRAIDDSGERFTITGTLYCISPLAEVNGASSVSIPELEFSGLIDWGND